MEEAPAFEKEAAGSSSGSGASEGSELQVEQRWSRNELSVEQRRGSMKETAAFEKEAAGASRYLQWKRCE
jgi:hypothetical protein